MTPPILIDYYNKGICGKSRPSNRRSFVMYGRNLLYMMRTKGDVNNPCNIRRMNGFLT